MNNITELLDQLRKEASISTANIERMKGQAEALAQTVIRMSEHVSELRYVLSQIINDLPHKRDWLNPDIEAMAKRLLGSPRAE